MLSWNAPARLAYFCEQMSESPRRGWRRPENSLVLILLGLLVIGGVISRLAGAGQDTPGTSASASPVTQAPIVAVSPREFATRAGNNRAGAAAAQVVAKSLYADHQSYWEVFIRTTPSALPPVDPTNPDTALQSGSAVTDIKMVMATESGVALKHFMAGGHPHEQATMLGVAELLRSRFPRAVISIDIYYGESHQHATATYTGSTFVYKVVDTL